MSGYYVKPAQEVIDGLEAELIEARKELADLHTRMAERQQVENACADALSEAEAQLADLRAAAQRVVDARRLFEADGSVQTERALEEAEEILAATLTEKKDGAK